MAGTRRDRRHRGPLLVAALVSLIVHVPFAIWFLEHTWLREDIPVESEPLRVQLVQLPEREELDVDEPEEEPEEEPEPTSRRGHLRLLD